MWTVILHCFDTPKGPNVTEFTGGLESWLMTNVTLSCQHFWEEFGRWRRQGRGWFQTVTGPWWVCKMNKLNGKWHSVVSPTLT